MIMGSTFGLTYIDIIILLIFGLVGIIANIKPKYREYISYGFAFVSISLFLIMLLTEFNIVFTTHIARYMDIIITLFIASLAVIIASQYSLEKEIEADFRGKQYYIGAVLKSFAVSFMLIWVLFKLNLFPATWLPTYIPTIDGALGEALLMYVIGAAFESMELNGVSGILGGFFRGLAVSSFFALILSFIIQWISLVRDWWIYHNALLNIFLVSFVVAILLYMVTPSKEKPLSINKFKEKKIKARVLFRDTNFSPHEKLVMRVKKESLFIPFKVNGYFGSYFQGDITYSIEGNVKKIRGKASEALILSKHRIAEEFYDNSEELSKEDFIFRDISLSELSERINVLLSEIKESKKESSIVKLPFVKIIESEDFDYIKAGPVTIYDLASGGSYIKIGPIKIVDGEVDSIFKMSHIILRDIDRGIIKITASSNKINVSVSGEKIKIGKGYEELQTQGKKIRVSGSRISVSVNNTRIILEGDEKVIIKKPNKKIVADKTTGTLTIITEEEGKKVIRNRDQAIRTIHRVTESVEKIMREALKEPEIDEVKDLIKYLNGLLGKNSYEE